MWILLAIITFIVGQIYLFRSVSRLDRFLERTPNHEANRTVLTIAFSDPSVTDHIAMLLEEFSLYYPEIDIVLLTGQEILDAVYDGRACIGFLPANQHSYTGLSSLTIHMHTTHIISSSGLRIDPMDDNAEFEVIWKKSAFSSPSEIFIHYLRDRFLIHGRISA